MKYSNSIPKTSIVIPFKNPANSKQRLSKILTGAQRYELAISLFEDTIDAVKSATNKNEDRFKIIVVTDSEYVDEIAKAHGADTFIEKVSEGETAAAYAAARRSIELGFLRQVVIPGDMAALDPKDVYELLNTNPPSPSVVLCPAVGDDGTNAIMTSPPDSIPFRFGKASLPEYIEKGNKLNLNTVVIRLKSFVLDVDTPEDLKAFSAKNLDTRSANLVNNWFTSRSIKIA